MKVTSLPATWVLGGAVLLAAGVYLWNRGLFGTAKDVTSGAVDVAGGVVSGVGEGVGNLLGVPDTNAAKCAAAKQAGDTWGVSFYCPATDFLKYLVS